MPMTVAQEPRLLMFYGLQHNFDPGRVISHAVGQNTFRNAAEAEENFWALAQWLVVAAADDETRGSRPLVMLEGQVNEMHRVFTEFTTIYERFCHEYLGAFVSRVPINYNTARKVGIELVHGTCNALHVAFQSELKRELYGWSQSCFSLPLPVVAFGVVKKSKHPLHGLDLV